MLNARQLVERAVTDDYDCVFAAVSDLLYNSFEQAAPIRMRVVEWLRWNRNTLWVCVSASVIVCMCDYFFVSSANILDPALYHYFPCVRVLVCVFV